VQELPFAQQSQPPLGGVWQLHDVQPTHSSLFTQALSSLGQTVVQAVQTGGTRGSSASTAWPPIAKPRTNSTAASDQNRPEPSLKRRVMVGLAPLQISKEVFVRYRSGRRVRRAALEGCRPSTGTKLFVGKTSTTQHEVTALRTSFNEALARETSPRTRRIMYLSAAGGRPGWSGTNSFSPIRADELRFQRLTCLLRAPVRDPGGITRPVTDRTSRSCLG